MNNNNVYDNPISFEQLVEYCNTIVIEENDSIEENNIEVKKEEKVEYYFRREVYNIDLEILHQQQELSYKIKKLSTKRLIAIFVAHRKYYPSNLYDRQLLISVVMDIVSEDTSYIDMISKTTYAIVGVDIKSIPNLSWSDIKEIRRLYNIKYVNENNGKIESCYSFNEIGSLYKISHIFCRNICLEKVYKTKK